MRIKRHVLVLLGLLHSLCFLFFQATSQPFIGVNYGTVSSSLPPPSSTASLLSSTSISNVRLYSPDASILSSLSSSNLSVLVGILNSDIPSLASSVASASAWLSANLVQFLPSGKISSVSVGNEVLNSGDATLPPLLLPAMQNILAALSGAGYASVRVSTVHSMAVMSQSDPPSAGAFHPDLDGGLDPILAFLQQNGSPFMINPYPWFAYNSDQRAETLAFCLFQPNAGRVDSGSGLTYMNMFDSQVDAIRAALDAKGFNNVDIVIAETGWPYKGDPSEIGATVENAQAYNGNLVKHLNSLVGTPKVPGKSVETYLFALYDEDLKPGPTSERSFGLYKTDLTMNYDIGLSKGSSSPDTTTTQANGTTNQPLKGQNPTGYCETVASVPGNGNVQPTSVCYNPNSARSINSRAHLSEIILFWIIFHLVMIQFS